MYFVCSLLSLFCINSGVYCIGWCVNLFKGINLFIKKMVYFMISLWNVRVCGGEGDNNFFFAANWKDVFTIKLLISHCKNLGLSRKCLQFVYWNWINKRSKNINIQRKIKRKHISLELYNNKNLIMKKNIRSGKQILDNSWDNSWS